jgi:N-glycosylase/DNA lyase
LKNNLRNIETIEPDSFMVESERERKTLALTVPSDYISLMIRRSPMRPYFLKVPLPPTGW